MVGAMKSVVMLAMLTLCACKGSSTEAKPKEAPPAVAGSGSADATQVGADVRAAMTELASYSQRIFAIMREAKDCDGAAKQLETLVPAFQELGPRMMTIKERLQALPPADRDRIERESEDLMQGMRKQFADADAIEQKGKDCEKSSAAFAAVAPKVMFVKKH